MNLNLGQFPTYKNLFPVQITPTTSVLIAKNQFELL
jgi:hypothetical protein